MLQGQGRRSAGLVPVSRAQLQLGDDLGLDAAKLTEQELPEQRVVAIPPTLTIQRHQEQAHGLQVAKLPLRTWLLE
jgi:hypothetical protein